MSETRWTHAVIKGPSTERPSPPIGFNLGDQWFEDDTGLSYVIGFDPTAQAFEWQFVSSGTSVPLTIFVSPTGKDSANGTKNNPVKTLAGAMTRIPSAYTTDVLIDFAPGTYANISPVSGPPQTYRFGPPSSAPSPAQICLVGKLATAFGPFTTSVPSDPGGSIIPLGGAPAADQYLGLTMVITASSDPSLVGESRLVAQSLNNGDTRPAIPFFTTVPAGTVISIARSSVILPYDQDFVFQVVGSSLQAEAIRFQHTGVARAEPVIDNAGGTTRIGIGSEIEFSSLNFSAFDSVNGTLEFGPARSHVVFGTTPVIGFGTGAYLSRPSGTGFVFSRSSAFSPSNVSYDSSVLKNVFTQVFDLSMIFAASTELVNSSLEVNDTAHIQVVGVNGRGAAGTRPALRATDSSEILALFSNFDGFLSDGILCEENCQLNSLFVSGVGAGGSGYGVRLRNQSTNNIFAFGGAQSITGATGDIVFDNNGYTPDVPLLYAGLTFFNDVPSGGRAVVAP